MLLPLMSESFGQYDKNLHHVWKKLPLGSDCWQIYPWKNCFLNSLFIIDVAFIAPSHQSSNFMFFSLHCVSVFISSKRVSQIFTTLIQTGDTNIFVFRGVISVAHFQIKSSFSGWKNTCAGDTRL